MANDGLHTQVPYQLTLCMHVRCITLLTLAEFVLFFISPKGYPPQPPLIYTHPCIQTILWMGCQWLSVTAKSAPSHHSICVDVCYCCCMHSLQVMADLEHLEHHTMIRLRACITATVLMLGTTIRLNWHLGDIPQGSDDLKKKQST